MNTIFKKLCVGTFGGAIALFVTTPATAAIFELSGKYGDLIRCREIDPQRTNCNTIYENSIFSATLEVDDFFSQSALTDVTVLESVNIPGISPGFFSGESDRVTIRASEDRVTVGFLDRRSIFSSSFELPPVVSPTAEPGDFLGGNLEVIQGEAGIAGVATIEIESATVTRISPPVSIPEPSTVAGLTVLSLGWLLRKKSSAPS